MIKLHPAARPVAAGFIPMVTVRGARGRMVGSKVSQNGNVFATASEALENAVSAAIRAVAKHPDLMSLAS